MRVGVDDSFKVIMGEEVKDVKMEIPPPKIILVFCMHIKE